MTQQYSGPLALSRLAAGNCPECGATPDAHDGWGGPGCSLTDNGVADRVHAYRQARRAEERPHRWRANEDADVLPFGGKDKCLDCGVPRYSTPGTTRNDRANTRAAAECPGPPTTETIVIPQQPPHDNGGDWSRLPQEPDVELRFDVQRASDLQPRYTPEEFAERARQAFAPPVTSRDVDVRPQLRNDSERWTDWGYE